MSKKADTEEPKTNHPGRRLFGRALVAGAEYAGSRMSANTPPPKPKKKGHKARNIVGLVAVAGAALMTEEIIRQRKRDKKKIST